MVQKDPPREKRVSKDTPGIAQFREEIEAGKHRREANEQKKLLKEQGVEDFDETLAEIKAEEARVDALRAKLAKRDGLRYKKLKTMDEPDLQRLWDKGEKTKKGSKTSAAAASQPGNSKVQPIGPPQRITTSSTTSAKRVSSPACSMHKSQDTKRRKKTSSIRNKPANAKLRSKDDTETDSSGEAGSGLDLELGEGENDSDTEDEDGDGDDGNNGGGGRRRKESGRGKGARGKTSDFTGTVKKMVDYATIRVCAKLASSGMFVPPREYKALVAKSWGRAAAEYGVDAGNAKYTLQKAHKQAIRARVNSFRSRIRDRLKPAAASVYRLISDGRTNEEAKEYVRGLFPHGYHTKVGAPPGTGHFQHSFLEEAIFESYYTGNNPVGIVYEKWFDPMPLEAIGFVCAVIRWVIQQHETGKYVKIKMSFEKLREYYDEVMESLRAFRTGKQSQRCVVVQSMLYVRSMEKAGRSVLEEQPKPAETTLREDDFAEDVPTAEELKLLARGSSRGRTAPKNVGSRSQHLAPSPTNQSNEARGQMASQRSSPPPPSSPEWPDTADRDETRERCSSVSLDHEESEDEREATPTPTIRTRIAAEDEDGENKEDTEDDDDSTSDSASDSTSDTTSKTTSETTSTHNKALGSQPPQKKRNPAKTNNKATSSQQPPKKKQKSDTQPTFLEKLAGSSQKGGKLTPKAARAEGKLKMSGGIIEKQKPRKSSLKIL
ncbi:unnamed protein product [Rhizoctonia solani]|uniref:DUF6532 domain-containing protein n=1 Tax=Rhizoctonia solani TaxID=456999 RepID=A0A8H3EAB4_9AGAM|nr:unnamed protein product [Rhizoctonia solani]